MRKTSNKFIFTLLGLLSIFSLLYFLTPIRYLFYTETETNTTTGEKQETIIEGFTGESQIDEKKGEIKHYKRTINQSYITISKYYQISEHKDLEADVLKSSVDLAETLKKIKDQKLSLGETIEKYYLISNLLLCASDIEDEEKQKIYLSNDSLKNIEAAFQLIKKAEVENPIVYQWTLDENILYRLMFYKSLNLSIKKISGENITFREIQNNLELIPNAKIQKYNLDKHRLIQAAIENEKNSKPKIMNKEKEFEQHNNGTKRNDTSPIR